MIRTALLATVLLSLFARPLRAEEVRLGFVDLRRALAETEEGRKARASLKKDFDKKQKEIDEQQQEVKKAVEELNKKRTLLPPETVRQKEVELQERVAKVQQTYTRHQQDLASKEEEATAPIVERLQRIIAKIAAAENFTVVLDKSAGVVFAKPHLDLTNEVVRRYNAGEEKGVAPASAGSKPAPSAGSAHVGPKSAPSAGSDYVGLSYVPSGSKAAQGNTNGNAVEGPPGAKPGPTDRRSTSSFSGVMTGACKCTVKRMAKGVIELNAKSTTDFITIATHQPRDETSDAAAAIVNHTPVKWAILAREAVVFPGTAHYDRETGELKTHWAEGTLDISGSVFETTYKGKTHRALVAEGTLSLKYEQGTPYVSTKMEIRPAESASGTKASPDVDNKVFVVEQ